MRHFILVEKNRQGEYIFFDNVREIELTLAPNYDPLSACCVVADQVLDFIPQFADVVACQKLAFDYEYNKVMQEGWDNATDT